MVRFWRVTWEEKTAESPKLSLMDEVSFPAHYSRSHNIANNEIHCLGHVLCWEEREKFKELITSLIEKAEAM